MTHLCLELFEDLGLAPLELVAGVAGEEAGAAAARRLRVDRLAARVRTLHIKTHINVRPARTAEKDLKNRCGDNEDSAKSLRVHYRSGNPWSDPES